MTYVIWRHFSSVRFCCVFEKWAKKTQPMCLMVNKGLHKIYISADNVLQCVNCFASLPFPFIIKIHNITGSVRQNMSRNTLLGILGALSGFGLFACMFTYTWFISKDILPTYILIVRMILLFPSMTNYVVPGTYMSSTLIIFQLVSYIDQQLKGNICATLLNCII